MDALVAGDVQLARDIAQYQSTNGMRIGNTKTTFCYYLFLQKVIADSGFLRSIAATELLQRFQQALEGQPSPRLLLCRALHEHNAEEFRAAFEGLLQHYADLHNAKRATITEYSAQAIFWPRSFVSIEALAWLCIAKALGMELSDQFQFCPTTARGPFAAIAVADLFESLDQALRSA